MALVTVVGATGRQGMAQIRQLRNAGYEARAISRTARPFPAPGLEDIEVRAADIFTESTLADAFEGSDAVFFNHPVQARRQRAQLIASVGRAAKKIGAKRVVWNTSSWIPDRPGDPFTYADNTDGINALWATGVAGTAFGSVLFMDNLLTDFARPEIINESRFFYPHNENFRANWISLDDVAKIMIGSLDRPDFAGSWMNIGGPEQLGPRDVAAILSEALGRDIRYEFCPPAEFGKRLVRALGDALPEEKRAGYAKDIADFYVYNNESPTRPFEVDTGYMLRRMPIELETLGEWAKRQDWSTGAYRPAGG